MKLDNSTKPELIFQIRNSLNPRLRDLNLRWNNESKNKINFKNFPRLKSSNKKKKE